MKIFFRLSKCESRQYEKRDNFFVEILDLKYIYSNRVKYEYQILIIGISKKKKLCSPSIPHCFLTRKAERYDIVGKKHGDTKTTISVRIQ